MLAIFSVGVVNIDVFSLEQPEKRTAPNQKERGPSAIHAL
jgi:hypothetical protein